LKRLAKRGDLWAKMWSAVPMAPLSVTKSRPRAAPRAPRSRTQSGRRLFVLVEGDKGNELWLDMRGKFKRLILRPDREKKKRLIALPAGDFKIDPEYFRGEVPDKWKKRIRIEDTGSYEVVEGSWDSRRLRLFFSGRMLKGEWLLEKIEKSEEHRSWQLTPA